MQKHQWVLIAVAVIITIMSFIPVIVLFNAGWPAEDIIRTGKWIYPMIGVIVAGALTVIAFWPKKK